MAALKFFFVGKSYGTEVDVLTIGFIWYGLNILKYAFLRPCFVLLIYTCSVICVTLGNCWYDLDS